MPATVVEWEITQVRTLPAWVQVRGFTFAASGAGARTLKPSEGLLFANGALSTGRSEAWLRGRPTAEPEMNLGISNTRVYQLPVYWSGTLVQSTYERSHVQHVDGEKRAF